MRLAVNGILRLDGKISANGGAASGENAGGGSGGTVWLSATNLTGAGTIYISQPNQAAQVVVDNGGTSGTNTPFTSLNGNFDVTVTGGANLALSSSTLSLRNLTINSNSFVSPGGGNEQPSPGVDYQITAKARL